MSTSSSTIRWPQVTWSGLVWSLWLIHHRIIVCPVFVIIFGCCCCFLWWWFWLSEAYCRLWPPQVLYPYLMRSWRCDHGGSLNRGTVCSSSFTQSTIILLYSSECRVVVYGRMKEGSSMNSKKRELWWRWYRFNLPQKLPRISVVWQEDEILFEENKDLTGLFKEDEKEIK